MTVFQNIIGTSESRFRIGLSGPTIYSGAADPTVSPPTPIADGFRDGDLYIRTQTGSEGVYVIQSGSFVQIGTGGGSIAGDLSMMSGNQIFADADGTAAEPAIAFTGDPDTGIYQSAANELSLSTAGTQRFAIQSDGTLISTTASYEALVLADNDIPNKKYVDDNFLLTTGDTVTGDLTFSGTAQVVLATATTANPSITFSADLDTGLYYPGTTGSIGFSSNGTLVAAVTPDGIAVSAGSQFIGSNGSVATPEYSFLGSLSTGIFSDGTANEFGIAINGVQRIRFDSEAVSGTTFWRGGDGIDSTPSLSFNTDPDTGFYLSAVGEVDFASGGTSVITLGATDITGSLRWRGPDGTASLPAISFGSDIDTGFYLFGLGTIGIASGGGSVGTISATIFDSVLRWRGSDGSAASPAVSFSSDPDTGMFLAGGDVRIGIGGTQLFSVESDGTLSVATLGYESLVLANNDIPNKLYVDNRANVGLTSIWVPAKDMVPTTTDGCAPLTQVELASGLPELEVLDFDPSSDEFAQFSLAIPNGWDKGTIFWRAYWTTASASLDNVEWRLQGVAIANDDLIPQAYGTATTVIDTALGANDLHVASLSAATTIAGVPLNDELVYFKISRNTGTASNLAADARLIGIKILYTRDQGNDA